MPNLQLPGALRFAVLAAVLGMALTVAAPVDAAMAPTGAVPAVCAYLGVINGTRSIDPGFAPGASLPPSPPASGSLGAGAVLLAVGTSTTSAAGTPATGAPGTASNYCHALPPLVPVGEERLPVTQP